MGLTVEMASLGGTPAQDDKTATNGQSPQEAAARLFRSVRAGRSWLRAQGAAALSAGACVPMRPGNDEPPVFMLPGAPGSILQLGPIASAVPGTMPVYAIKPRGLGGDEAPCDSIREMAEYSIAIIREVRPAGPYLLVGYSAGGLVALEMAQVLTAAGHQVPLVVLMDTYPSRQTWPLRCHVEVLGRQVFRALWALRRYSLAGAWREAVRRLRSLSDYLAASGVKALPPPPVLIEGSSAASRRLYLATYNAGEAYRPARYGGKVVFIQPDEVPNLEPRSPWLVWRQFLTDMEVRRVPGTTHLGMVDVGAAATAAAIGECLARAGFASQSM
ncbi:MAG TPA: alpha/beta fold hydrolase [Stellaceae bacterium]|nr:alpha/beta fold hydrolase [Stellaceae bacterium]